MDRRKLFTVMGGVGASFLLPVDISAKEIGPESTSNSRAIFLANSSEKVSSAALYKIPPELVLGSGMNPNRQPFIPLHMEDWYRQLRGVKPKISSNPIFDQNQLRNLPDSGGRENYFQYLNGVITEAGRSGRWPTFILEMPVDLNQDMREWGQYLEFVISSLPDFGRIQIGNEMIGTSIVGGDARPGNYIRDVGNWKKYAELFVQAYKEIRKKKSNLKIGASAPLYLGDMDTSLGAQLSAIHSELPDCALDFLPLHFYDDANKLESYIQSQTRLLLTNGFSCPVVLSEYGTGEGANEHPSEAKRLDQARKIFDLTGETLRLIQDRKIESACVYTAYSKAEPIFSMWTKDAKGQLLPTVTWDAFVLASRVFNGQQHTGKNVHGEKVVQTITNTHIYEVTWIQKDRGISANKPFVHFGSQLHYTQVAKVQAGDRVVRISSKNSKRVMEM